MILMMMPVEDRDGCCIDSLLDCGWWWRGLGLLLQEHRGWVVSKCRSVREPHVVLEVRQLRESLEADLAGEGLLSSVNELMTLQLGGSRKLFAAVDALVPAVVNSRIAVRPRPHLEVGREVGLRFTHLTTVPVAASAAAATSHLLCKMIRMIN
jgi:hypothetical protein